MLNFLQNGAFIAALFTLKLLIPFVCFVCSGNKMSNKGIIFAELTTEGF